MNRAQFLAIVRLRWDISRNQWKKAGMINFVLMILLIASLVMISIASFFVALIGGWIVAPRLEPEYHMLLWDVIVCAFLSFWMMALLTDLQRSELVNLEKFLHLPITLRGAFVLNYLSCLVSPAILMLLPLSVGYGIAMMFRTHPAMFWTVPLTMAFLFMVSTITYQFRGWIARLMENKRRQGTVIAVVIAVFVLSIQGIAVGLAFAKRGDGNHQQTNVTAADSVRQKQEQMQKIVRLGNQLNLAIPAGWLPLGIQAAARGNVLLPGVFVLGMTGIGALSLSGAYRSSMRAYLGTETQVTASAATNEKKSAKVSRMARQLPGLTEQQSALTMLCFQNILRAPEIRLMLLTPAIIAFVYGTMLVGSQRISLPDTSRPFLGVGAVAMTCFSFAPMLMNMFAFDRAGFRLYMLMPVRRRELLLAKNLAFFPLAVGLGSICILLLAVIQPHHASHVIAGILQVAISYLLYCPVGSLVSILFPIPSAIGTGRSVNPKLVPALVQGLTAILAPIAALPALAALGAEYLVEYLLGPTWIPVYLLLTLIEGTLVVWFYLRSLNPLGNLLHRKETEVLSTITSFL